MFFVTVIVPTFNRCSLLKRALESILQQTVGKYEIIVVDDGSTDQTAEMMRMCYPQIKYLYQSNQGVSSARNKGIALANGNWLAFLDSDDTWLPHKLESQIKLLQSMPDYKICHTEERWVRKGVRVNQMNKHKKSGGWIFRQCLPLCAMSPSSILIHRSVFDAVGEFDITLPACEDYDLWLRITARYPVLYIAEPQIIKYGGHEDQLSKKYWGMDRFRIQALEKIIAGNELEEEDKHHAIKMLLKKCTIFQQGALKRGKMDVVQHYQKIIDGHQ